MRETEYVCPRCEKSFLVPLSSQGICFSCSVGSSIERAERARWRVPAVPCEGCGRHRGHWADGYCTDCHIQLVEVPFHHIREFYKLRARLVAQYG